MTEEGHPVVERVRLLQLRYAADIEGLSPDELKERGITHAWPKAQAIRDVAKERGVTERTIHSTIKKWKEAEERQAEQAAHYAQRHRSRFELYGQPVPPEWLDDCVGLQEHCYRAIWYLRKVQSHMKQVASSEWYPKGALKLVQLRMRELAEAIKNAEPAGVCPYCKQADGVMEECAPCWGSGMLPQSLMRDVQPEFLSTSLPVVLYRGERRPLAEFRQMSQEELL